jgi:hypothetical protein
VLRHGPTFLLLDTATRFLGGGVRSISTAQERLTRLTADTMGLQILRSEKADSPSSCVQDGGVSLPEDRHAQVMEHVSGLRGDFPKGRP